VIKFNVICIDLKKAYYKVSHCHLSYKLYNLGLETTVDWIEQFLIGWSQTHQYDKKRLQQIMNLSTCVSTQPFGYNTNGGKLLTSLAFSKEVYQYVYNKYNTHIHGITTMSIYGKSIQYDRLPQLKFVGYTNGNTTSAIPQEVDEDGNVISEGRPAYTKTNVYETADEAPEGAVERTRLGVRYSELLAFIIAAI
jgi:hypothetical protein